MKWNWFKRRELTDEEIAEQQQQIEMRQDEALIAAIHRYIGQQKPWAYTGMVHLKGDGEMIYSNHDVLGDAEIHFQGAKWPYTKESLICDAITLIKVLEEKAAPYERK